MFVVGSSPISTTLGVEEGLEIAQERAEESAKSAFVKFLNGKVTVRKTVTSQEALGLSMGEREPVERLGWAGQGWLAKVPNKMPVVFEGLPRKLFKDP